jgi:hypothetical protein
LADSLLSERVTSKKRETFMGGIGFEHRSHLRSGIYFVGGIDLVGKISHRSDRLKETISRIDSIGFSATAHEFYHRSVLSSNSIYEEDIKSVQIGAGISLGLLIPLGSRWWIQGQYYMSGLIGPTESRTIDKMEGTTENTRYSSVEFNSGPGLAQVAVFFRF